MQDRNLYELIRGIPKTEIHIHLEAVASVDTIWKLKEKHSISLPDISTKDDLTRKFKIKSLDEFIALFIDVVQACFLKEEDIELLLDDAKNYFKRNNIKYAEVFFAPSKFIINGLDYQKIITLLDEGAKDLQKNEIKIKYIIDVSRTYGTENAMNNLDLTLDYIKDSIIGIGLGGAEKKGRAKDYESIFSKAREKGLHVVAHAGEDVDSYSIWDAIKHLKTERIGHGISAINDQKLMEYLKETQIPLEVCPTSNLFTRKYATTYKNHPIRKFFDKDLYVTVNSDDPVFFNSELSDEYLRLLDNEIFSLEEIFQLIKNNIYATFMDKADKDKFWKEARAYIEKNFN